MHFPSFRRLVSAIAAVTLIGAVAGRVSAENVPLNHPSTDVVKKYLAAVVSQDWKKAATMLLPTSLERKQKETIAIVKMAPTMTEENMMLEKLGAKEISDLEKMTPVEFYMADRQAVHQKMKISPDVKKKKEESLKIQVVSLGGEDESRVLHAVVRTSQETMDARIEELFLISMVQDKADKTKWYVVPDMMRPITTPLDGGEGSDGEKKPDPKDTKGSK